MKNIDAVFAEPADEPDPDLMAFHLAADIEDLIKRAKADPGGIKKALSHNSVQATWLQLMRLIDGPQTKVVS